ncbi:MAG: hypothetical protein P4L55_19345, partial [Syntrophobacteraceae bacterium]|nr:hypothetical protein [Syntrophobacteraceae bacterium]
MLAALVCLQPGAFAGLEGAPPGTTPNGYFEQLAKSSRRGLYPRGFSGEQTYWTIVGVDGGGAHSALLSEEGAVEPSRGGFSVEPFLIVQGRLLSWADVTTGQTLEDNYLPMPEVRWKTPGWELRVRAFASGDQAHSRLNLSYTVINDSNQAGKVTLVLAVRPFQVDPPTQTLNLRGGFSPIHTIDWNGREV